MGMVSEILMHKMSLSMRIVNKNGGLNFIQQPNSPKLNSSKITHYTVAIMVIRFIWFVV